MNTMTIDTIAGTRKLFEEVIKSMTSMLLELQDIKLREDEITRISNEQRLKHEDLVKREASVVENKADIARQRSIIGNELVELKKRKDELLETEERILKKRNELKTEDEQATVRRAELMKMEEKYTQYEKNKADLEKREKDASEKDRFLIERKLRLDALESHLEAEKIRLKNLG